MTEGIETDTIPNSVLRRARGEMQHRVAVIIAHEGGLDGAVLLPGASIIVGRGEEATLQLDDKMLSRAHARFELAGNGVAVEDLGSTNGVFYQSRKVHRIELEIGEEVFLGKVRAFVQRLGPGEAPPTSKRTPGAEARRETTAGTAGTGGSGDEPPVAGARMTALLAEATRVADAQITVLLRGETGTGKEVLARFLHKHSPRRAMPMLSVSCAALPEQLLVSTLFGHERGAFTGAVQQRRGLFEEAHGGTLFLDEVGELSPTAQAALLRVLEALDVLRRYGWPGNVRELRNVIEGAVVIARGERIGVKDLPQQVRGAAGAATGAWSAEDLRTAKRLFEAARIREALLEAKGDKKEAALILKMSLRTLYHKIQLLGLEDKGD